LFSRELFVDMYRHMEWADATVWNAVPADSPPDVRLRQLLSHVHVVQRAFLQIWTGKRLEDAFRSAEDFSTLSDLREWARPYYAEAHAFVAQCGPDALAREHVIPWGAELARAYNREPGPTTLGDTCFQVVSHTTYHRGQVNVRLRELGVVPPLVDYIAWLWLGRPVAEWRSERLGEEP
jgi:uncharacterized damage-inducible protein DinB